GEELPFHANFQVDHGNDRPELGMRTEELVFLRRLTDRDGNDAGGTLAFHARKIPAHSAELLFFRVQLLLIGLRYACGIRRRSRGVGNGVAPVVDLGIDKYRLSTRRFGIHWLILS